MVKKKKCTQPHCVSFPPVLQISRIKTLTTHDSKNNQSVKLSDSITVLCTVAPTLPIYQLGFHFRCKYLFDFSPYFLLWSPSLWLLFSFFSLLLLLLFLQIKTLSRLEKKTLEHATTYRSSVFFSSFL